MSIDFRWRWAHSPRHALVVALLCAALCPLVVGCGSSTPVAPAHGIVTIDGKPLPGGAVVFTPLAAGQNKDVGKSAYGDIRPNGTFVLGTFTRNDGAIVGVHRATILGKSRSDDGPPPGAARTKPSPTRKPLFDMLRVMDRTFEVVAGQDNEFAIELSSGYVRQFAQQDD